MKHLKLENLALLLLCGVTNRYLLRVFRQIAIQFSVDMEIALLKFAIKGNSNRLRNNSNSMKIPFSILLLVCFFCSCRKDPTIPEPYFPPEINLVSTVGSWWKYERYDIDSLGQVTATGTVDTIFVSGDSIINGNKYIHLSGTYFGIPTYQLIRDSLTYIVNSKGAILCSYENFGDTTSVLTSIQYNRYGMTEKPSAPIVVPAGIFDVYDNQWHYYNSNGAPFTACDTMWIRHEYFADGIGVIALQSANFNLLQAYCEYSELRLVEYYIAP